jgi:AraC family transcriptional regulator
MEHRGAPQLEAQTVRRLIQWCQANRLPPAQHRSYGIHYNDPRSTPPADYRVDFCVSFDGEVRPNAQGVVSKIIPGGRCALVRHFGSRQNISAAVYLYEVWLPNSAAKRVTDETHPDLPSGRQRRTRISV